MNCGKVHNKGNGTNGNDVEGVMKEIMLLIGENRNISDWAYDLLPFICGKEMTTINLAARAGRNQMESFCLVYLLGATRGRAKI